MFVSHFEVPRDTIGCAAYWDQNEIPDEDELVEKVEKHLAEKFIERYDAVREVLGDMPKMYFFGGVRTKEWLDADPNDNSSENIYGYWNFLAQLDIGIAGVK